MPKSLIKHLLVPVANEEDARETARVLDYYEYGQITVVHIIEKGEGVPDKLPLEQAEKRASNTFGAFRGFIPEINTETVYRRDVVAAIIDVAVDVDASAIAFHPRGGNRVIQFLSGDKALKMIMNTERPVIALPDGQKMNEGRLDSNMHTRSNAHDENDSIA